MSIERPTQNRWDLRHSASGVASLFRLFFRVKRATTAQIDFHDYADYPAKYEELAIVLGHSGKMSCT